MNKPVFYSKILLLFISGAVFYFNFSFLHLLIFVLPAVIFLHYAVLKKFRNGIYAVSGIIFIIPLYFLLMGIRIEVSEVPQIPDEYFIRKSGKKLISYPGQIHIVKMITPGIYLADFRPSSKEEGYFPNPGSASLNKRNPGINRDGEKNEIRGLEFKSDDHAEKSGGKFGKDEFENEGRGEEAGVSKLNDENTGRTHLFQKDLSKNNDYKKEARKFKYRRKNENYRRVRYIQKSRPTTKYSNRKKYKNRTGFRGKTPRKLEWKKIKDLNETFQVTLFLKNTDLYEGCSFHSRLYGKTGLVKYKNSSFYEYLKKNGGAASVYLKESDVTDLNCSSLTFSGAFKRFLTDVFKKYQIDDRTRSMILGIILGRSGYLEKEFKKSALELGILHLFAASGLHLGILYLCFYFIPALILGKKHPVSLFFPLPFCFLYLIALNFPVSLMRAFAFLSLTGMKSLIHRKISTGNFLLNSAFVLLLVSPAETVSLSGAMSFFAVGGILLFHKTVGELFSPVKGRIFRWILSQLSLSISAGLFITPLLIYTFQAHSFLSVIFNAAAVPVISFVLPFVFAGIAAEAAPFFSFFSEKILSLSFFAMNGFVNLIDFASEYSLYVRFSSWSVFPFYASLVMILFLTVYGILPARMRKRHRVIIFLVFFAVFSCTAPPGYLLYFF